MIFPPDGARVLLYDGNAALPACLADKKALQKEKLR
jgi:hypothetical protein